MAIDNKNYSAPLPELPKDALSGASHKSTRKKADNNVANVAHKALPHTPDDLRSEDEKRALKEARAKTLASPLPPTPHKLSEREIKKFVVVKRDGKEVLKHHSALKLTETLAEKIGRGATKKGVSPLVQAAVPEKIASLTLNLRKALKTKNEGDLRLLLSKAAPDACAKAYDMLALSKDDLALIQKALFQGKKPAVAVNTSSNKELHTLAIEEKKLSLTFAAQLAALSENSHLQALSSRFVTSTPSQREALRTEISKIFDADFGARIELQAKARDLSDTIDASLQNIQKQMRLLPQDKQLPSLLSALEQQQDGIRALINLIDSQ